MALGFLHSVNPFSTPTDSMKTQRFVAWALSGFLGAATASAAVITVTTANNITPGAGRTSLKQALEQLQDGDTIAFNIPGAGPHFIETPPGGYPYINKNNVTIDGYTQPGSAPNTNSILAPNSAQIQIVLDSRNGEYTTMDYDPANGSPGYGDSEAAILGIIDATNVHVRGLSFLGIPVVGADVSLYFISFARYASAGHVSGCWLGIAPDRATVAGASDGITAFRIAGEETIDGTVIGVKPSTTENFLETVAQFNVIVGCPAIPIIIEGADTRISGNFLNVMPDGLRDYTMSFDPAYFQTFEGTIEIGRKGHNTLIGVDGDGFNDANERNIIGGAVPPSMGGYDHNIEFYGNDFRTNIVIAGNYIGVGIDGVTRFTNGVPALNAAGNGAEFRFGSDFDGVSDDLEGNVVANYWPPDLFPASDLFNLGLYPNNMNFFDELNLNGIMSGRGSRLVKNLPFPVSPTKTDVEPGAWITNYYVKALADVTQGIMPVINTNLTTTLRLVGSVPIADTNAYPHTIIDVYTADPEAMQYGLDSGLTEFSVFGFVEGDGYLGSFVEGSAQDANTAPGQFDFNISSLGLQGGFRLIVTANYSKDPVGTHNGVVLTSPFSEPADLPFTLGGVATVGLTHIVPDKIVFDTATANLDNWEPYIGVLGTSTFLIEANTFADDAQFLNQRYAVAFQPAAGGANALGEGFYADNGTPFKAQINLSRQNGNPGRVAGDRRPGATNFIVGGEATLHMLPEFQSDNRWNLGFLRAGDARYAAVQTYHLNPATLAQTPASKGLDAINGRLTTGDASTIQQLGRFGGDVACLDNGNFVVTVDDRSLIRDPANSTTAVIMAPDGTIVKDSFLVRNLDIWSNLATHQGGFVVRVHQFLHFFDNAGNELRVVEFPTVTGVPAFDTGRGDGTRIAGHINSPYVYLSGPVSGVIRLAVWDARDQSFVTTTNVSELLPAHGGSDPGEFNIRFDRGILTVDALDRVVVAFEAGPSGQEQIAIRILALNSTTKKFSYLTHSFFPFVNYGPFVTENFIRTFRPSVAMTTRQICVAAKGSINTQNQPELGPDSLPQTTFYAVITHPAPADDPTPPIGGQPPRLSVVSIAGGNVTVSWVGGTAPYTLQRKTTLADAQWQDVITIGGNTHTLSASGSAGFFRVVSQ